MSIVSLDQAPSTLFLMILMLPLKSCLMISPLLGSLELSIKSCLICKFQLNSINLDHYQKMIDYVTYMPQESDSQNRSFKFPYVACELLMSQKNPIWQAFFPNKPHQVEIQVQEQMQVVYDDFEAVFDDSQEQKENQGQQQKQKEEKKEEGEVQNIQEIQKEKKQQEVEEQKEIKQEQKDEPVENSQKEQAKQIQPKQQQKTSQILNQNPPIQQQNKQQNNQQSQAQLIRKDDEAQKHSQQQHQKNDLQQDDKENIQLKKFDDKKLPRLVKVTKVQKIKRVKKQKKPRIRLLDKLFQVLNNQQLNYILIGYFCKIVNSFLVGKGSQMVQYFYDNKWHLKLIDHIQSSSVCQLLTKFLTFQSISFWPAFQFVSQRLQVVIQLIKNISNVKDQYLKMANSSAVLTEFISKLTQTQSIHSAQYILQQIYSPQFISSIMESAFSSQDLIVTHTMPVVLAIYQGYQTSIPQIQAAINHQKAPRQLLKNTFIKLLQKVQQTSPQMMNSINCKIQIMGFVKMRIVMLVSIISKMNLWGLNEQILNHNYLQWLLSRFDACPWNNILHNIIQKTLYALIQFNTNRCIKPILKFLSYIANNTHITKQTKQFRKGYMGHITKVGRFIEKLIKDGKIQLEDQQDWEQFCNLYYYNAVFDSDKNLGGYCPPRPQNPSPILFHKQQIVQFHHIFLTTPPRSYASSQDLGKAQQIDKIQIEQQRLYEQYLNNKYWQGVSKWNVQQLMLQFNL